MASIVLVVRKKQTLSLSKNTCLVILKYMTFLIKHVPPNPSLEYCKKLLESVPPETTEIVSQGGGSTIDVGKWISRELGLKHTAIPTTAGTGSEVTKYCVLMVDGKKTTFADNKFIPSRYILDPRLVTGLPYLQTVSSGFDALSQALESFWSKNATPKSKLKSQLAIDLILDNLIECVKNPKREAPRMNMLLAANFAGRAINVTKTNVCHAISYPLTEKYGIPHGIACAMTLPYFVKKFLGVDIDNFVDMFEFPKYDIDVQAVADEAISNEKLLDCPIEVTKDDIIKSLKNRK